MKVVLTGLFYQMAILRYIEAALRRRSDVELFCAGPSFGNWIPWQGGMYVEGGQLDPNLAIPRTGACPVQFVENYLPWEPDIWIQVDAGFHLQGKPKKGVNVVVGTDPHALNYDNIRPLADVFYCMQTPYMQQGDVWLPYAYDPVYHHSNQVPITREYDAGFVGMAYENRKSLIEALRTRGHSVYHENGPIFEQYRLAMNKCRVGLNWSSLQDTTARVFEVMAMQICLVTNRTPDLTKLGFVDGRDYLGFNTQEEAVAQVELALSVDTDPSLNEAARSLPTHVRDRIAFNGRTVVKPHTWDARVDTILSVVNR